MAGSSAASEGASPFRRCDGLASRAMLDEPGAGEPAQEEAEALLRCDFCGEEAPRVRRVALDGQYDRLQRPHHVQYACEACSEAKERARLETASG